MPYGKGCKIQFSLPEEDAAKLRKKRIGTQSDSLIAKELLTQILQRSTLLKSGELDGVAIREKLESLDKDFTSLKQRFATLEKQAGESTQSIRQLTDGFESLSRDWLSFSETYDKDRSKLEQIQLMLDGLIQAITSEPRRTATANDDSIPADRR